MKAKTCGHCGNPMDGFAGIDGTPVCHGEICDCYREVTVYGQTLGQPMHHDETQRRTDAADLAAWAQSDAPTIQPGTVIHRGKDARTAARAMLQEQIIQERADFPLGGGKHTFVISVNMRGSGCDWSDDLEPVTVQAYSLFAALQMAAARPFPDWFPPADDLD